ncbi:hypothetical protein E8E14_003951 [Neopestalotiopsis sp. 37M]|nr:hypothetical protein E8E14_003951 [Neopestalotiopsis sp. 37M]
MSTSLVKRFYEPLILLWALGKTRGEHVPGPADDRSQQSIRRQFFNNIAYLCDHIKGGESTSAICPEELEDRYNVWVASNQTTSKIANFVEDVLKDVQAFLALSPPVRLEAERDFIMKCIEFGCQRIQKEAHLLFKSIAKCAKYLQEQGQSEDIRLKGWLQSLHIEDTIELCLIAYDLRHAPERRILDERCEMLEGESEKSPRLLAFRDAKHLFGRLAHHVRAPTHILRDAHHMERLFERYFVCSIPVVRSVPRPPKSVEATLEPMLGRMLPAGDARLSEYTNKLKVLDHKLHMRDKVIRQYKSDTFKPFVHAEIQVLEYFYRNRLQFMDGDRYISCNALAQVNLCASSPALHPDSTTGITVSVDMAPDNQPSSLLSLEQQVAHLNIGEDDSATTTISHDGLDQSDSDLSDFGSATSVGGEWSQRVSEVGDDSDSDTSEVDDDSDEDSDQEGGAVL